MSKLQTEILNHLDTPVNFELKNIYKGVYKLGPVTREIMFTSTSLDRARKHFEEYISILKSSETQKVVSVGIPKPLAVDLDDEIEKIMRKSSTDGRIGYLG